MIFQSLEISPPSPFPSKDIFSESNNSDTYLGLTWIHMHCLSCVLSQSAVSIIGCYVSSFPKSIVEIALEAKNYQL